MASINDVYEGLTKIGESIAKMGGSVQSANRSFSLKELADGVETIPTYIVTGGGQAVQVFEMPNTTIAVYDTSDNLIGSGTTDATTGGVVNVNIATAGTYRVTATKGGNVIWNKQVTVSNGEVTIVKTPLTLDDYTEDEIEASCVNHYAHHMFNVGDYRTEASFMGSTGANYRKKYILGFNQKELADGSGYAEITWGFLYGTPSAYNFDSVTPNTCSWVGSLMRQRCLPSGEDYYRYDSTVDSSTSGTYYIYDYTNKTWIAKTLPADFDVDANYYVKNTTASDGIFYTDALPSGTMAHAKKVKNLTWTGNIKGQTTINDNFVSTALIETAEKLFLPSGYELFGKRPTTSNTTNYPYNQNEGNKFEISINDIWSKFSYSSAWLRSPSVSAQNNICQWASNNGYINGLLITSQAALPIICYCQ